MTIKYNEASIVPHFSRDEMASMKKMLTLDLPMFEFDPAYVEHVENFHGGKPIDKYFTTRSGKSLPIDRFLNYANLDLLDERALKGLNANVIWSRIDDRLNRYLLPFAAVANGDFLCFDYENGFPPSVVLWSSERSAEDAPDTEPVATTFDDFLGGLVKNFPD